MRNVPLAIFLVLLAALPASAQIGPPQPRAQEHGYSLGVGFHNVCSRWMPYEIDLDRDRFYLEGSYAFTDSVEAFGRVGGSGWVINNVDTYRPSMVHDIASNGWPVFVSGGLRGQAWQRGRWSVGGSVEAAWYPGLERSVRWTYNAYQDLFFEPTLEINAALSVAFALDASVVYGGPLLHFGYSNVDVRTHEFGPDWDIEESIDAFTIRDKAGAGGFLGWRTPIGESGWKLEVEGMAMYRGLGCALGFYKSW